MIYFVVEGEGRLAIDLYLAGWGQALKDRVRVLDYPWLLNRAKLPLGSYVFTEVECLSTAQVQRLARCWQALEASGAPIRLLNHPLKIMRRYELLRCLAERGSNLFDVYRLTEARTPKRFPVFLRPMDDHAGPRTELLADAAALQHAVEGIITQRQLREEWIATEFLDSRGDDGLYRKYGAFHIAGEVIPRHLQFSKHWVVKATSREIEAHTAAEELEYLRSNPHAQQIRELFALARIDYGRIDYTIVNGQLQVFEINMNPQIVKPGLSRDAVRRDVKALFAQRFGQALAALDCNTAVSGHVSVRHDLRPLYKRRPPLIEMLLRVNSKMGLQRYEPAVFRFLLEQKLKRAKREAEDV